MSNEPTVPRQGRMLPAGDWLVIAGATVVALATAALWLWVGTQGAAALPPSAFR